MMKTHNPARYSLTEEGLALGELESLEGTKGPEGDREEARSEGNEQEEGEEGGPGIVDLTVSDDDEEEKEEERIQPAERPTSSASQPRVLVPGMFFSGNPEMYRAETQIPGVSFPAPTRSSSVWTSLRQRAEAKTASRIWSKSCRGTE
ncbi:NFX1-type zinc finger-containing protein 1-like [Gymnodraco acuticeps]|uniref:NFX1-type zinc finger-containing protein 1-like n=1 Tax=Gymnodraco acuticeps TaxID=8218 RepID=A0A6P8VSX0_GYMAC|nr:NFX1-type zinc finger-containing protein 1-like [Gymnodraco acuticeps]